MNGIFSSAKLLGEEFGIIFFKIQGYLFAGKIDSGRFHWRILDMDEINLLK